ncbi:MAG: polysaccharide biosynthesis C-terminal domain-containing protein [Caldilineaceae bacterium]|nr:polysaccharide biosynthesis C-terminal domain-containing protein [Caldilineaceae bacterium]
MAGFLPSRISSYMGGSMSAGKAMINTVFTNYGIKLLNVLTGIILARSFGAIGRGEWEAMRVWPATFITLGILGLDKALIYYASRTPEKSKHFTSTYFLLVTVLSLLWCVVGWIAMPIFLGTHSNGIIRGAQWHMLIVPMGFWASSFVVLSALKRYALWNFVRQMIPVLWLLGLLVLLVTHSLTPWSVMWVSVAAMAARLIIIMIILARVNATPSFRDIDTSQILPMSKYGIASSSGSTSQFMNFRLDQLIMVGILAPELVGLYVISVSWSSLVDPAVDGLAQVAFPELSSKRKIAEAGPSLARYARLGLLLAIIASIPLIVAAPFLLPLIYGNDFSAAVPTAIVLVVAAIPKMANLVLGSGLRGIGHPITTAWAEGLGLVLTLMLLYLLLPKYDIMGAALTSLVAYSATFLILVVGASRHANVSIRDIILPTHQDMTGIWKRVTNAIK